MNEPGTATDLRHVRSRVAVATAVLLAVFGALVAGCGDDTSSTSGNSAGQCAAHTVDFQGVIYYQYSSRPTPVKYGKKLGTGDEYIHCDDASQVPPAAPP